MDTAERTARRQQLRKDFCSGKIPFGKFVSELRILNHPSRECTKYRVIDTKRARELCIEVFDDYVKVGWQVLPNALDNNTLQWLIDNGIVAENNNAVQMVCNVCRACRRNIK